MDNINIACVSDMSQSELVEYIIYITDELVKANYQSAKLEYAYDALLRQRDDLSKKVSELNVRLQSMKIDGQNSQKTVNGLNIELQSAQMEQWRRQDEG